MSIVWGRIVPRRSLRRVDRERFDSNLDIRGIDLAVQNPYAIALPARGRGFTRIWHLAVAHFTPPPKAVEELERRPAGSPCPKSLEASLLWGQAVSMTASGGRVAATRRVVIDTA